MIHIHTHVHNMCISVVIMEYFYFVINFENVYKIVKNYMKETSCKKNRLIYESVWMICLKLFNCHKAFSENKNTLF